MTAHGTGRVSLARGEAIYAGTWVVEGDGITVELDGGDTIFTHLGSQKSDPEAFARVLLSELVDRKLDRNIPKK